MQRRDFSFLNDECGMIMIMALVLMGLMSAMAGAYAMLARTDAVLSGGALRQRSGFYAAEAGLNIGMAETAEIFKNSGTPQTSDYEERTIDVGNRTVEYKLDPVPGYDPCTEGEDEGCYTTIPAGEKFAGLKSIPYRYSVTSTAMNTENQEEAKLGGQFDVHNIPIFQFLAFYANDLEINPGPVMNLHGRIHTNGKLYLSSGNGLTVSDSATMPNVQVSSAKTIYHYRKDGSSSCAGGAVTIDKLADVSPQDGSYDPLDLPGCNSAALSKSTVASYLGSLSDGVSTIQIPKVNSIARGSDPEHEHRFWEQADLRIVLRLDKAREQINFGAADLCPGGPGTLSPKLYPIEVQEADGSLNTTKTRSLLKFMCQQRGAIFYNDVPKSPATVDTIFPNTAANYIPQFGDTDGNDVSNLSAANGKLHIYRRVGVDTGGDGIIDRSGDAAVSNSDRNDDICPYGAGTRPWWRPDYCNTANAGTAAWPNNGGTGAAPPPDTSWFNDMDYRRGGFYNRREHKWMYLLNVNIRALIEWNAQNNDSLFPHNDRTDWGLVFFLSVQGPYSTTSPSSNPVGYGVRVFDSADLDTLDTTFPPSATDPTGLTVVSDQAIYIESNYNYRDKYPAAVIGDSLNILSQGWEVAAGNGNPVNDLKSAADLSTGNRGVLSNDGYPYVNNNCGMGAGTCRNFSTNTALGVNAAFIANVNNSVPGGAYNGGLENYPRFHEDWNARTFNYRGSFVSLGVPQHVNGAWCGTGNACNIYNPPARAWDYDSDFNTIEKLPPLTPKIVYVQQRRYTRFYK